jgi:addiction module HigA family antidote
MSTINVHPGEALREFMEDYSLSQSQLATELRVPVRRINAVVRGERSITADTAVRLARFFNNRADFWLGLQELYDINRTCEQLATELDKIHPVAVCA